MRRTLHLACVAALAIAPAFAQAGLEVSLTTGRVVIATELTGDPRTGLEAKSAGETQRIDGGSVLAIRGGPARVLDLPAAYLAGGEVIRGVLTGGDGAGDRLDLLSPVLGPVGVRVDRLTAFVATGSPRIAAAPLPQGVDEALLQRAAIGHDVIAGALHQFGEQGVRFQPEGAAAPRWFGLQDFLVLRIADATARAAPAPALLLTRAGDRMGVAVEKFTGAGVICQREDGGKFELRLADLASLSFASAATFLSDLEPTAVVESGFDGEVVHPWQRDAAATGGLLVAGGRTCAKGLGVHAKSRLSFAVPEGALHFWTRVGLDDTSAELGVIAQVDVRVLVGDVVKFERKAFGPGTIADTGLIAVRAGGTVTLEVDFGAGRDLGDRVDWLLPAFLPGGRRP